MTLKPNSHPSSSPYLFNASSRISLNSSLHKKPKKALFSTIKWYKFSTIKPSSSPWANSSTYLSINYKNSDKKIQSWSKKINGSFAWISPTSLPSSLTINSSEWLKLWAFAVTWVQTHKLSSKNLRNKAKSLQQLSPWSTSCLSARLSGSRSACESAWTKWSQCTQT